MVDKDLKPSLIEVNHLPSWGTDSPIDEDIKSRVITQALSAINVNAHDKRFYENARRKQSRDRLRQQSTIAANDGGENEATFSSSRRGSQQQPALFDSNSAERRIRQVYRVHAPEKLAKVKELLDRYRGYEEWLARKIEKKYNDDSDSSSSSEEDDDDSMSSDNDESIEYANDRQRRRFDEEERRLKDYDRIYPPLASSSNNNHGKISLSRYKEMENYITEMDEKQQQRLTCPLQHKRINGEVESEHIPLSRGDGWIGGNVHIRPIREEESKIMGPPTKKQVEFADRLSRGYSVGDTDVCAKSIKQRKSHILHQGDFVYEEDNPFYHLIDRVRQTRDVSKEIRKRAEDKLSARRSSKQSGSLIKQQMLSLGNHHLPLVVERGSSKFYTKRRVTLHN